jgi:hypothetical protein
LKIWDRLIFLKLQASFKHAVLHVVRNKLFIGRGPGKLIPIFLSERPGRGRGAWPVGDKKNQFFGSPDFEVRWGGPPPPLHMYVCFSGSVWL